MQNPQFNRRALVRFFYVAGGLGFALSLMTACLLSAQGDPAFLLLWGAAALAMMSFARINRKWSASLERIATMRAMNGVCFDRRSHLDDIEDVSFREIPGELLPVRASS